MPLAEPIYLSTEGADESDLDAGDTLPPDQGDDDGGDDGNGGGDPGPWVTIATFWQPGEAHLARLRLEQDDIDCVLIDENMALQYTIAIGGIKLRVPERDRDRARHILSDHTPIARTPEEQAAVSESDSCAQISLRCPECGSHDIDRPFLLRRNVWAIAVMLLLTGSVLMILIPVLLVVYFVWLRPYRCGACGNVFNGTPVRKGFDVKM